MNIRLKERMEWRRDDFIPSRKQTEGRERQLSHSYQRTLSPYEKRVDFEAARKVFDEDAWDADLKLRQEIKKTLASLLQIVKERIEGNMLTPQWVGTMTVDTPPAVLRITGEYLMDVWRKGRDLALRELPENVAKRLADVKRFSHARLFHLPGQHDQCDHSVTGECVDPEWEKSNKNPRANSPLPESYGDMERWVKERSDIYGSRNEFLTSDEYKQAYPFLRELYKAEKLKTANLADRAMAEVKAEYGDRVFYDYVTPWGVETYKGIITSRAGIPYIKLDEGQTTMTGAKSLRWHKGWRKEKTTKSQDASDGDIRRYAGLEPTKAVEYLLNTRPWLIKGIIDDKLKQQARIELSQHLLGGRTLTETLGRLRDIFEPWIGDQEKITPTGMRGIGFPPGEFAPENVLMAYRLENIIRTESVTAFAQGRAAVADEADDYVIGFELSAILDTRTTEICKAADGIKFRRDHRLAEKLMPALHYQCRTIPVFVVTDDLPVEWSTEAELDRVVRLIPEGFK